MIVEEGHSQPPSELPERIGPYRIEDRLGEGGMGEVYLAYDERLTRHVAIKHLHRRRTNARAIARLRREAKATARLNHPTIVQVYDLLESDDGDWVVMELVDGSTLHDLVRKKPFAWQQVLRIAREMAIGLQTAHDQHIVHRDLKTENVMLTRSGRVKILDFGLAKSLWQGTSDEPGLSVQGEILGTVRAMSPEQAKGEAIDHRSDLFSLGSLLYETLTGKPAFAGTSAVHTLAILCSEPHRPVQELREDIPDEMAALIDHLLQKNPDRRPQSANEVLAALDAMAEHYLSGNHIDQLRRSVTSSAWSEMLSTGTGEPYAPSAFGTPAVDDDASTDEINEDDRPTAAYTTGQDIPTPSSGMYTPTYFSPTWGRSTSISRTPQSSTTTGIFIRTLLYLEVTGRDALLSRHGNDAYDILAAHDRLVRDLMVTNSGVEIQKSESFLLLFERPADAAGFALAYQQRLAAPIRSANAAARLKARVGIHLGEVRMQENTMADVTRGARPIEVEGMTRLVAFRTMDLAQPGQVLMTHAAYELARRNLQKTDLGAEVLWASYDAYEYQGVGESIRVFEVGLRGLSRMRRPPSTAHARSLRSPSSLLRRHRLTAAIVAVLLVLAAVWWLNAKGEDRRSLAVLGFHNLSEQDGVNWVSRALSDILSTELAVGGQLRTVAGESIVRMKREVDLGPPGMTLAEGTLRKVGRNLSTEYVVLGSYMPQSNDRLQVYVHLQSTRTGETILDFQETGTTADFIELVSKISSRLRQELNLGTITDAQVDEVEATLASNQQAMQLYAEGLELLLAGNAIRARGSLEQAIEIDPDYALAHAALSRTWRALGYDKEAARSAERASQNADRLPREQNLVIEGLHYETIPDWPKAINNYRALWQFYPDNIDHGLRLADVQIMAGRANDALETLAALRKRDAKAQEDARVDLMEAEAAYWLGDYDLELEAGRRAEKKAMAQSAPLLQAEAHTQQGWAYYNQSKLDEAMAQFSAAEKIFMDHEDRGAVGMVLAALGSSAQWQGRLVEAEELYSQALKLHETTGNRSEISAVAYPLAYLTHELGKLSEARRIAEEAIEGSREVDDRLREGRLLDALTWIVFKQSPTEAEAIAREELQLFEEEEVNNEWRGYPNCYLARMMIAFGRLPEARQIKEELQSFVEETNHDLLTSFYFEGLSDFSFVTGDLETARRHNQKALQIRRDTGENEGLSESRVREARLLLAEENPEAARQTARELAHEFYEVGREDLRNTALVIATQASLALNDVAAARSDIDRASDTEQMDLRLTIQAEKARLTAAEGDAKEALRRLAVLEKEAADNQLKLVELQIRYYQGLVELQNGGGRQRLDAVATEAETLGYLRLAGLAKAAS